MGEGDYEEAEEMDKFKKEKKGIGGGAKGEVEEGEKEHGEGEEGEVG